MMDADADGGCGKNSAEEAVRRFQTAEAKPLRSVCGAAKKSSSSGETKISLVGGGAGQGLLLHFLGAGGQAVFSDIQNSAALGVRHSSVSSSSSSAAASAPPIKNPAGSVFFEEERRII